jgi:hypothetical protein
MRLVGWSAAVLVTASLTACAAKPVPTSAASGPPHPITPPVTQSTRSADDVVPWVARPGSIALGAPLPASPLPTAGPPCAAADVRAAYDGAEGAAGSLILLFTFTNSSTKTCALRGTPQVVATEPGKRPVTATPVKLFTVVPVALSPGGHTQIDMQTMRDCAANHGGAGPVSTYHALVMSLPGGGQVTVPATVDVECGLYVGEFGVQPPDPVYPTPPLAGATFKLELPASVKAGDQLRYVVDIANPTAADIALDPCPSYLQRGPGDPGKTPLELNCDVVHDVAAGQTVRFEMELSVPVSTPSGQTQVCWTLVDTLSGKGGGCGSVDVVGADTPCASAQLAAAIAGPATVPGAPNLYGMKGIAAEVSLTLTNRSDTTCSVRGSPTVEISNSRGSPLKLTGVDQRAIAQGGNPATPTVDLAPGQSATTHLYWYLPWCAPDPNPVTVTITLAANGAAVSAKPAGGWTPPTCDSGAAATPGETSADPLQPA